MCANMGFLFVALRVRVRVNRGMFAFGLVALFPLRWGEGGGMGLEGLGGMCVCGNGRGVKGCEPGKPGLCGGDAGP